LDGGLVELLSKSESDIDNDVVAIVSGSRRGGVGGGAACAAASRSKWPRVACVGLIDHHSSGGARLNAGALVEGETLGAGLARVAVCTLPAVVPTILAFGAVFEGPRRTCGIAHNATQQMEPIHAVKALVGPCAIRAVGSARVAHRGSSVHPGAVGAVVHTAASEVNEACVAPEALVRLITSGAVISTGYASVVFSYQVRSRRALVDASSVVERLGVIARCALVDVCAGRAVPGAKIAHSATRVHARRALSSASSIQLDHVAEGATGARIGGVARVAIGAASLAISGVRKELAHGTTGLAHPIADELATLASITIDGGGAIRATRCTVLATSIRSNVSTSRA